ncbi:MAG: 30S ribosomal protein S20 [Nitrospirae bacterium]|nr:MAG: 30S ribosomal protein S20 [Nitrospirota bacterium]
MAAKAPVKKNLSAIKKARQSEKRNERNRTLRTKIRNIIKAAESTAAENNKEETTKALRKAEKVISSAASKGILHKNNASRKISRLTKRVNASGKAAAV